MYDKLLRPTLLSLLLLPLAFGCPSGGDSGAGGTDAAANGPGTDGKSGDKKPGAASGNTLNLAVAGDPETLDPSKMSGAPEGRVAFNCFEGLWMPAMETGDPVYGVAESHEVSEDGLIWTIKLRKNAKWSNGDAVTAKDFDWSWKRVLTPGFDADYAEFLDVIKNAAKYRKKEIEDWKEVGVEVVDDHTLKMTLENPTPYLPELLAFYTFFPVHPATVEKHGDAWTKPENVVSNGPYKLTELAHQQYLILSKNDQYWDKANVKIDKIKIHVIKDNTAMINAFNEGKIDIMSGGIPVGKIPALKGKKEFRIDPLLGSYYYRVNVNANDALKKKEVRKALSLAVNRDALTKRSMKGLPSSADGFVPPMKGYTPTVKSPFDPDAARKMLADAGYPKGEGFPEVTLLYNTDENHKLVAEIIQQMWSSELGIKVKLENKEWKTYLESIDKQNYDLARAGWIGDYNDPLTFLYIFTTGNGNNDTGWGNPEYDKLLKDAQAETDQAKRMEMMAKAEAILIDEAPIIPIYFYRNAALVSTRVKGWGAHNRDVHLAKYMSLQ